MIASLGCVLVSRLMFNLRETREPSLTPEMTTATSSAPTTTTILLHTLTNLEGTDEAAIREPPDDKGGSFYSVFSRGHDKSSHSNLVLQTDIEMVQVVGHCERKGV